MTRYTNLGRKRTHLAAGLNYREEADNTAEPEPEAEASAPADAPAAGSEPPKKKRRRGKPREDKRRTAEGAGAGVEVGAGGELASGDAAAERAGADAGEGDGADAASAAKPETKKAAKLRAYKEREKLKRKKDAADRAASSEKRRLKRIAERHANKVCFACRETGHAAQMCPNAPPELAAGPSAAGTGFCYRCGSNKHNLSKCRKPENAKNPLPFALCFVCSGKGHLAAGCPQNAQKGVYPNGGACMLCSQTTHLARDCPMRQPETAAKTVVLGTVAAGSAGADEDDFHAFKRTNVQVDRELQEEERRKKAAPLRVGRHSGAALKFGPAPMPAKPKKVVTF